MTKAYSYVRFSSKAQASGDSLRRQMAGAKEFAQQNGLELVEAGYSDLGISGYRGENATEGALGALIEAIKLGKIEAGSYLIVESLDRLSREKPSKALSGFLDILNRGVYIATLTDKKIYSEHSNNLELDLFGSLMVMSRAHEESKTKGERVKKAWENKRHEAKTNQKAYTAMCPAWIKKVGDSYELIEERAEVIRKIFQMSQKGLGATSITKNLNSEGVPTFGKSDFWHNSYIKKILENKSTYGAFQAKKGVWKEEKNKYIYEEDGEAIENFYPKAIAKEQFYNAKSKRRTPKTKGRNGDSFSNLFKGLIECGYCGAPVHYINKGAKPKGGTYLRCSKSRAGGDCKSISLPYTAAEEALLGLLTNLDYLELVPEKSTIEKKRASIHESIETLRGNLEEIVNRLARLANAISISDAPPETLIAMIQEKEKDKLHIEELIKSKQDELFEIKDQRETAAKANEAAVGIVSQMLFYESVEGADANTKGRELREQLNNFFKKYISEIELYDYFLSINYQHKDATDDITFYIEKMGQYRIWQGFSDGKLVGTSILKIKEIIQNLITDQPIDKESKETYERLISLGAVKDFDGYIIES